MQSANSSPSISDYSMVALQSSGGQHEFANQNQSASQNTMRIGELIQASAAWFSTSGRVGGLQQAEPASEGAAAVYLSFQSGGSPEGRLQQSSGLHHITQAIPAAGVCSTAAFVLLIRLGLHQLLLSQQDLQAQSSAAEPVQQFMAVPCSL